MRAGSWGGLGDVNSRSIGVELDNNGSQPFPEPQMRALEDLLAGLKSRWPIAPEGVIAHSDMAPQRKADPGARFDWRRLARSGLSVWPTAGLEPLAGDAQDFVRAAAQFGYPGDVPFDALLTAFRLRFRPWQTGALTPADLADITDLARRFPVDGARPSA